MTFLDEGTWEGLRARLPGGCQVVSVLGHGGEGIVLRAYSAQCPSGIAVKIAHDEQGEDRIRNEREVLSALRGVPGVVQMLEWDERDDAILTLAIVEGQTMDKYFESGGVTVKQALGLLARLADVLASVHARGVVHRDLKPENVIVRHKGGATTGSVVLIDFGLGIRFGVSLMPDCVSGTAPYMSPEAFDVTRYPGPAQDLYALGVMLYRVCEGHLPFKGVSLLETCCLHHIAPVPALSRRYPSSIEGLIALCLEKRPERRIVDAKAFARALREAIAELGALGDTPLQGGRARTGYAQTLIELPAS